MVPMQPVLEGHMDFSDRQGLDHMQISEADALAPLDVLSHRMQESSDVLTQMGGSGT